MEIKRPRLSVRRAASNPTPHPTGRRAYAVLPSIFPVNYEIYSDIEFVQNYIIFDAMNLHDYVYIYIYVAYIAEHADNRLEQILL